MSKMSFNDLVNSKLSDKLVTAINSLKGGNQSTEPPASLTILDDQDGGG